MSKRSMLPKEMKGVMHVTGARGIGKTYLVSQLDFPENILFIDFENKGESVEEQLSFGEYHAITRGKDLSPIDIYRRVEEIINSIEQDRFTVAILDNISWLELALRAQAESNLEKYVKDYGLNIKNVRAGRFGGLSSVVNFLISDKICNPLHAKGVQLIAITSHVKEQWGAAGPIPNKMRIKGASRWQELSILSLVLVPGDFSPTPSALVMKEQLGKITAPDVKSMTDKEFEMYQRGELGHEIIRRLPMRIPKATMQEIRRYIYNPADLSSPKEGEIPGREADTYSDKLSSEQISYMSKLLEHQLKIEKEDEAQLRELEKLEQKARDEFVLSLVSEVYTEDTPLPSIKAILSEMENGQDITIPEIAKAVSMLKEQNDE